MMSCLVLWALAGSLTLPPGRAATTDLQRYQGAWKAAAILNADGTAATPDELDRTRLVVVGDRFALTGKNFSVTGRFTLDPGRSPKAIDVVLDKEGGDWPTRFLGIYRIDGETRRSCFAMPDEPRPAAFPGSPKGYLRLESKRDPQRAK